MAPDMRAETQHLTDEQLLDEIKRQWREKGLFEYELEQLTEEEAFTPANDYLSIAIEEHIAGLEQEAKRRELELPDRWEYVAQFESDPDND